MTRKITPLDRILLLITGLLCAYQVVSGIAGLSSIPTISYTIAFGVLLVASLLILILGFEILDSPWVVIISTLVPLSLATGLIAQYRPAYIFLYILFSIAGILAVSYTRLFTPGKWATIVLILVHTIAGLTIFGLPIYLSLVGITALGFSLVGVGGALMGIGGILLSFLKVGKPILSQDMILAVLPTLLLLTAAALVFGFARA